MMKQDTKAAEIKASVSEVIDVDIQNLVSVNRVALNVSQNVVVTTEDKLKLNLQNHLSEVEGRKDWVAPLSVFIALVLALVTADFKDLYLNKDTWKAIFIIASFSSFCWFCFCLKRAFSKSSIESLIEKIKSDRG
jgi:hypothetical protein